MSAKFRFYDLPAERPSRYHESLNQVLSLGILTPDAIVSGVIIQALLGRLNGVQHQISFNRYRWDDLESRVKIAVNERDYLSVEPVPIGATGDECVDIARTIAKAHIYRLQRVSGISLD